MKIIAKLFIELEDKEISLLEDEFVDLFVDGEVNQDDYPVLSKMHDKIGSLND